MATETIFPSEEWFAELARIMKENESSYRELGAVDCTMVVKVDDHLHEITFEGFGVKSIRRLESLEQAQPEHFVLEGPMAAWREMIENIRANGAPDLQHTLNYLTFPDDPLMVTGPDQLEIDGFYRFNESLQRFFNGAAGVTTTYAD